MPGPLHIIEGVSTSTAGFVGPTRSGPVLEPQLVTSMLDFERIYGDGQPLAFQSETPATNCLWQSVRAFFAQGGTHLYICRIFNASADSGVANKDIGEGIRIQSRFPGSVGNVRVRFTLVAGKAKLPTVSIAVLSQPVQQWAGLTLQAVFEVFARTTPIIISSKSAVKDGSKLQAALVGLKPSLQKALLSKNSSDDARSMEVTLSGGNDGERPRAVDYEAGLKSFETIAGISIVAAPGSDVAAINALVAHATLMRYSFAILDSGKQQSIADVSALRSTLNSTFAAMYCPWVRIVDPISGTEISLPPSGFVAGIYARVDATRGVWKAPANEVVTLATGFEVVLTAAQQDPLNIQGINCFRTFPGKGHLLWGARTISSDPEWKYVNVRRYLSYLDQSIDQGTRWVVFEPNNEPLWASVRQSVEAFLIKEWRNGALLGATSKDAFYVRCGRGSTMTQADIDNGRLIVEVGVAVVRPAEFVIFRIGQWTVDKKP